MKAGWQVKKLGEVCEFINRGISPVYVEDGGIAVINQKCIRDHSVNLSLARRHSVEAKRVNSDRLVQQGDVLVNSTGTGTLGRVAQVREQLPEITTVDSHVTIVRPSRGMFYQDFFGYALIAVEELIQSRGAGCGGQTELARRVLATDMSVSFPIDLPEQQRLVEILDEAFASIDAAKANAEQNLDNARELFDSYLAQVFSQHGEDWVEKRLGDIAEVQSGGTPLVANKDYWNSDIAWYSSGELNQIYTCASERTISIAGLNNSNAKLFPKGSLLIGMYDTAALKMSVLDRDATFNQAIAGVKPNEKVSMLFVLYAINAIKPQILSQRRGVRQKNLSLTKIKEIPIGLPNMTVQQAIVVKLDTLSAKTKKLEAIYRQKIAALDELKQSLLHQAFTGEL